MSRESKNGYDFYMDMLARVKKVHGQLFLGPTTARSRFNQIQAGKPDRRSGDDGGHFIAARFNGPNDNFNHFAQDANFNRSAYKALENSWANDLRAGKKVFVDIIPQYAGTSRRPYRLTVTWYVNGERNLRNFPNEPRGASNGRR
ncbi:DNA/RNA non-specific endonuclease [Sphingobium indicum]|uniref:DNA/RNA non-specific endonuclease n=1 Tax=Sphingobium TaxID=165695 RepID=UPI000A066175|nr:MULTISPECIES: DNA/RNA non-specific endonuclease [Sphingobium]